MIKFNRLLRLSTFSNIKFSQHYQQAFRMNHQIKSCLNLQQLNSYRTNNDEAIQKYAKTSMLEYLNQIPLHFNLRAIDTPLKIYFYILTLKGLNVYQEQLIMSNLEKMNIYSGSDARRLKDLIKQQVKKIETMIEQKPFDFVDSLNWLAMRKDSSRTLNITVHSLEVLEGISYEKYHRQLLHLINLILRKIQDLEWMHVRKFKKTFEFMCYKYAGSFQSEVKDMNNCDRLSGLQLHLLGYDSIPQAITNFYMKLPKIISKFHIRSLEICYQILNRLPHHCIHRDISKLLHKKLIESMGNKDIHLQMFPFSRVTKNQLDSYLEQYAKGHAKIANTIFNFNNPDVKLIFINGKLMPLYYADFMRSRNSSQLTLGSFVEWITAFSKLSPFYKYDLEVHEALLSRFKEVYNFYLKKYGQKALMDQSSITTLFHLLHFEEQFGISPNKIEFLRAFEDEMQLFIDKKFNSIISIKNSDRQLEELVEMYKNSNHQILIQYLGNILLMSLFSQEHLSMKRVSSLYFHLESSKNAHSFKNISNKVLGKLKKNSAVIADYYMYFTDKTNTLTLFLIYKLWLKYQCFEGVGRLIAHTDILQFQQSLVPEELTWKLENTITSIAQAMNEPTFSLKGLSLGELTSLLRFCRWYFKSMQKLAPSFFSHLVRTLQTNYDRLIENRSQEKQMLFLWELKQLSQLFQLNEETKTAFQHFKTRIDLEGKIHIDETVALKDMCNFKLLMRFRLSLLNKTDKNSYIFREVKKRLIQGPQQKHCMTPQDIKKHLEDILLDHSNAKNFDSSTIEKILLFCLQELKVQEGPQFYMWTLRIAQKYKFPSLIVPSLRQLCVHILDDAYILKLLNILIKFPEQQCHQFSEHLFNLLKHTLPNRSKAFLPSLFYLTTCYTQLPKQTKIATQQMVELYMTKVKKNLDYIFSPVTQEKMNYKILKDVVYYLVIIYHNPWLKKSTYHNNFTQAYSKYFEQIKAACFGNSIQGLRRPQQPQNVIIERLNALKTI